MKKPNPRLQAILAQYGLKLLHDKSNREVPGSPKPRARLHEPHTEFSHVPLQTGRGNVQALIRDTVQTLRDTALHAFLDSVFLEPEILRVLVSRHMAPGQPPRLAIEYLRSAADIAVFWNAPYVKADVLYVATLLQGLMELLAPCIVGKGNANDILFTIVRTALHRLDDQAPGAACLLRLCLGWGNADEIDAHYIPGLQQAIRHALKSASGRELVRRARPRPN